MTDWDGDSDTFLLFGLLTPGWGGVLLVLISLVFAYFASTQRDECAEMHCAVPLSPTVVKGECLCVQKATPTK